ELPKIRGAERIEKCSYLKNRLNRAKQVQRSMQVEIRELISSNGPNSTSAEWEKKAKDAEAQIQKLWQDVEWAETSSERPEVNKKTIEQMTAKEVTGQALQLQEQVQERTGRVKQIVANTLDMANDISNELQIQGEQLQKIQSDLHKVESNLKRADKQMRVFM
ncbi:hypothetical protein HK096_002011, partial [Nowakowskiella sp. JEL0078]